jgi:hypothetical protein
MKRIVILLNCKRHHPTGQVCFQIEFGGQSVGQCFLLWWIFSLIWGQASLMGPYKIVHLMHCQFSVTVASSVVIFTCTETIKLFKKDVKGIPNCILLLHDQITTAFCGTRVGNFLSALSLKVGYSRCTAWCRVTIHSLTSSAKNMQSKEQKCKSWFICRGHWMLNSGSKWLHYISTNYKVCLTDWLVVVFVYFL